MRSIFAIPLNSIAGENKALPRPCSVSLAAVPAAYQAFSVGSWPGSACVETRWADRELSAAQREHGIGENHVVRQSLCVKGWIVHPKTKQKSLG